MEIDIVFDGPPSHESGRFVEVESPPGTGINLGEWVHRPDGFWALRFRHDQAVQAALLASQERAAEAQARVADLELMLRWLCVPDKSSYGDKNWRTLMASGPFGYEKEHVSFMRNRSDGTSISGGRDNHIVASAPIVDGLPLLDDAARAALSESNRPDVRTVLALRSAIKESRP